MKALPGFHYDSRRKRVVLDGYVPGSTPKVRRQKTIDGVTRDQALAAWKVFRSDLESGRAIEGPLTLRQFVEKYYELIASAQRASTRSTQGTLIRNHLLRFFGDAFLDEITSIRVIDFMADMRNLGKAPSYVNDAVRVLKMLLRQAVERDVISEYPIRKKVPREREPTLRLEMQVEERTRFFDAFDDESAFRRRISEQRKLGEAKESRRYEKARRFGGGLRGDREAAGAYFLRFQELREYFVVAVETGLRKNDLRNLQWCQIDLKSGFIRLVMEKTRFEAEIPISAACREALERRRGRSGSSPYVFVDAAGRRYSITRIQRTFVLAKRLAGISRRLRLHDLRHTFGCRLASGGVSLQIIAAALGHTTTRMAERYARPSQESMRAITRALDGDPVGRTFDARS